jgi:rare lipoprotein A
MVFAALRSLSDRPLRFVVPLGAAALAAFAVGMATADAHVQIDEQQQALAPSSNPAISFEASFADFEELPTLTETPPGAVDLASFDPPREIEPKPEPVASGVIRSLGTGVASYYGRRFHGRLTANGERFNMNAMTAAHKTLPFGTKVRVTYPRNGRSVVVRINDRGPFIRGRTIDLSRGAATKLGMISSGHARVRLDIVR